MDFFATLLPHLCDSVAKLLPHLWDPAASLPQWTALLCIVFTTWVAHFIGRQKPNALKQEDSEKKKHTLDMMEATIAYADADQAKPVPDRKPPEASRVLNLLWDDTHEERTTRWGIPRDHPLNARTETLYLEQIGRAHV